MTKICLINEMNQFSKNALKVLKQSYKIKVFDELEEDEFKFVTVLFVRLRYFINKKYLSKFPKLKYLCSPTTGLNHIDKEYCKNKNITIISLKNEKEFLSKNISATAEYTWALFLCAWRKIIYAYQDVLDKNWDRDKFRSSQLAGQTLGIIGLGRIGKKIYQYAETFNMTAKYYDPYIFDSDGKIDNLFELVSKTKILFICCEYTNKTHHMINNELISNMKNESLIINTARGEIIDETVLLDNIIKKNLFYAADVVNDEHLIFKNGAVPNLLHPKYQRNVIITPHIAGACNDSMHLTEEYITKKLTEITC